MMLDSRPRFVKLVRSRIALFLGSSEVIYQPVLPALLADGLRKKLIEEAAEYLLNPSLDELADVYEVVRALAYLDLSVGMDVVTTEARHKREERGDFTEGFGMYVYSTAPARHEGSHA